jgi:hypothetical protein
MNCSIDPYTPVLSRIYYVVRSHMFSVWMFLTLELSMTYFDLKSMCKEVTTVIQRYSEVAIDGQCLFLLSYKLFY